MEFKYIGTIYGRYVFLVKLVGEATIDILFLVNLGAW